MILNKEAILRQLQKVNDQERDNEYEVAEKEETKPLQFDVTGRMIREGFIPPKPQRKPETISPTRKGNELLDFIGRLESSDNYNIVVGGEIRPLTKMTVKEVRKLQKDRLDKKLDTAVGRYQIKQSTFEETARKLGIVENSLFDETLQDQMGRHLLKIRGFEDFKAGKISTEELIKKLSKEWAAISTDKSNKSYYDNDGKNRALTNFKTIKDLLEKP